MAGDEKQSEEATQAMDQDRADGRFRPADLLNQAMIQELTVAPDGSAVVYARRVIEDGKYRKRLWRVGFDGGAPEPLTTADANDGWPRFSPDGRALLFLSDRGGRTQPWVLPLGGGEATLLAEFPGDARTAEWSPDGERVLVVAHQAVIMVCRYVLEGLDEQELMEFDEREQIANASLTRYDADGSGGFVLRQFNHVDHILVEDEDVTEEPDAGSRPTSA